MLKSRRFRALVLGLVVAAASAGAGEISWRAAITTATNLIFAYIAAIGLEDVAASLKGNK